MGKHGEEATLLLPWLVLLRWTPHNIIILAELELPRPQQQL